MPAIGTVRQHVAWSYANLARAHSAVAGGHARYRTHHHMIRAKLYKGLVAGTMRIGSMADDERVKLLAQPGCAHCGSAEATTIDHLIPRLRGGADAGDNLVAACRSCNSAKGARDMLLWYAGRDAFPSLLLLRRHLKIVAAHCEAHGLMDLALTDAPNDRLPIALSALPHDFPPPPTLKLWATAA